MVCLDGVSRWCFESTDQCHHPIVNGERTSRGEQKKYPALRIEHIAPDTDAADSTDFLFITEFLPAGR